MVVSRSEIHLFCSLSLFAGLQKVKMEESCCAWSAWRPSLFSLFSLSLNVSLSSRWAGMQGLWGAGDWLMWECLDWGWRDGRRRTLVWWRSTVQTVYDYTLQSTVGDWSIPTESLDTVPQMMWKLRPFSTIGLTWLKDGCSEGKCATTENPD